jgi:carbamoylphosphate synthase large subunit
MPKRTDISKIMDRLGPIVIGRPPNRYSGTQACKALRKRLRGVLINSTPATIMTDEGRPTGYIEPITHDEESSILRAGRLRAYRHAGGRPP